MTIRDIALRRREVKIGGRRVRYQVAGQGEPVVLVHGLSGSTRWWRLTLPVLARRYQVYLVDLPGFGAMARNGRFALAEAADWLVYWMRAVHLGQADIIGHSMGGYIALLVASLHPEAVRRLIVVDAAGVPTGRALSAHLIPLLRTGRRMAPAFLPILASDALRARPRTLLRTARDVVRADIRPYLRSVQAPTLVIWGDRDTLVPLSTGEILRQEIPNARLVLLHGAGHVPMFERPRPFNEAVLAFLTAGDVGS